MERIIFDILAEPVGDLYYDLLDYAVNECAIALLIIRKDTELYPPGTALMSQLERFLLSKEGACSWPGNMGTVT
jgi:hypothetical protein